MILDIISFITAWLTYFAIYSIVAITLNLEAGTAGIVNFGKVAFFGLGAYIGAIINTYLLLMAAGVDPYKCPPYTSEGVIELTRIAASEPGLVIGIFILSLVLSFLITGLFGYFLTYPIIRVGSGFVGFALLSVGEVLRAIYINTEFVGGIHGMLGIPQPFTWIRNPLISDLCYMVLTVFFFILTYMLAHRIINSPLGRSLRAIRDDDIAALCLGKDVPRMKSKILFISSGLTGVAGALYASYFSSVNPQMFVILITFNIWAMIIIGGLGNPLGSVLGALILSLIERILAFITPIIGGLPFSPDYLRPIIIGTLMVTVLIKYPRGMLPEKPIKTPAMELLKRISRRG